MLATSMKTRQIFELTKLTFIGIAIVIPRVISNINEQYSYENVTCLISNYSNL